VEERHAHYYFIVKGNQKTLLHDIALYFTSENNEPEYTETTPCDHGRVETRKIRTTTELNDYLDFPHVGQAFALERVTFFKKSGKTTQETVYGITSRSAIQADPQKILKVVRGHWCIENSCHYILDWAYDEDRCRIRKGYGPENITRLRRFAIGLIKSKGVKNVTQQMRRLSFSTRTVLDYLKMTKNSRRSSLALAA